jgi:hypothetical protein
MTNNSLFQQLREHDFLKSTTLNELCKNYDYWHNEPIDNNFKISYHRGIIINDIYYYVQNYYLIQ